MNKNMLLIVNPKAGKGTIQRKLPKIVKNFEKRGYETKTVYTKVNYNPSDILKENNVKWDLIVCCGGDGTLNELINAVMKLQEKPQIGFIPLRYNERFCKNNKIIYKKNISSKKY